MKVAVIYNKPTVEAKDVIDIFGPQAKEHYNLVTVELVASALEKGGHNVKVIDGNINVIDELHHFMPRVIAGDRPGMVFNMAYGIQGQNRYTHIPAMLEMLGVPYVGSGPQAHAIALDKVMSKIVFQQYNLPTPRFWVYSGEDEDMDDIIFPAIVKPKMEAVSIGLRIVDSQKDLREAVRLIIDSFQQQALVEAFISGREFAVSLLGNGPELEIFPIVEFNLCGDPSIIQTREDKMKKPLEKICPAKISDELAEEMRHLARGAFHALGIYDFARIDLRMDTDGHLYILELNSMASLGLTGSYVHSARVAGYTYESMVNRMLEVAAVRYFGQTYFEAPELKETESKESKPLRVRVRSYVRSNLTTMTDNLRRMVRINTYVHNSEGVNQLGDWLSMRLSRMRFKREVFPQTEVANILYFCNHEDEQNDILLLGHLDSFYSHQDYVPFREERGLLYGAGVAESKGGLTVMLTALQSLRFTRRLRKIRCGILLTTDATLGGRYSKKLVSDYSSHSRCVVGLQYGNQNGGIIISCSGMANFQVELNNIKGAQESKAQDVIKMICQKILAWQKLTSEEEGILIKPTLLEARISHGLTPDYATSSFFVQFKEQCQGEELEKRIRQITKKNLDSKFQVQIKKIIYRPPVLENDPIRNFFNHVQKIAKRLEVKVTPVHRSLSSDIGYVPKDIPVLEGLGPIGGDTRSPNEYILRDSLVDRAAMLAMVIRLSTEEF